MRGLKVRDELPVYGIERALRRCFLVALLFSPVSAFATTVEITKPEECAPAIAANPEAAREAAAVWSRLGGGAPARLCEAAALEAMGATVTAAQMLTALGENDNRALVPAARASILEDAGRLWLLSDRPDISLKLLISADKITRPSADRWILRARAEAAEQNWAAAEASLGKALADRPADALALSLHAATLRHLDRPEAALIEARKALVLDPDLAEALFESAAALKATGQSREADQLWLRLIEVDPGSDLAALARQNLRASN